MSKTKIVSVKQGSAASQFCKLYNITEAQFSGKEKINGYLDLPSVTSLPGGFNPTVGGDLDLPSVTSLPGGFNPTVGGSLYLPSVTSLPEALNPPVGGSLDLGSNINYKHTPKQVPIKPIIWGNKYIKADGIFTEITHQKGNVYKVKKLTQQKEFYLVTDGNNKWAHGDTLKEARENLIYKIGNRDTSKFKGLSLSHLLTFTEAIEAYRSITGACSFGTKDFVISAGIAKKSYTIAEIISLTKGRFGNGEFAKFFI